MDSLAFTPDLAPVVLDRIAKLLESLQALHSKGSARGDLTPADLLDEEPGLAVPQGEIFDLLFRAPELSGAISAEVGPQADIYSVGALLYLLMEGRSPFEADSVSEALRAPFCASVPALLIQDGDSALLSALDAMIVKMMRVDPKDRYPGSQDALNDLRLLRQNPGDFVPGTNELRSQLAQPALCGRRELLAKTENRLRVGGIVQLVGEAGFGKSRLAEEIGRRGRARGLLVLRGRARPRTADVPLQVVDELCQDLTSSHGDILENVLSRLGRWRSVVCQALPTLGGYEEAGPEDFAWVRTSRALSQFLQLLGTAARPALLLLEDLHWSAPDLLEILSAVQGSENIQILVTSRRELSLPGPRLKIGPLSLKDSEKMAQSMLGRCRDAVAAAAAGGCGGSPYRLVGLLERWVHRAEICPTPEGWAGEPGNFGMATLSEENWDLDLLDDEAREALKTAAVIGPDLEPELLSRLAPDLDLNEVLERATRIGILQKNNPESWSFSHDLVRESLLDQHAADRRSRHLSVARALDTWAPHRDADIAFHFHAAGDHQSGLPFARRASTEARKRNALSAAQTYLNFALAGAPDDFSLWEELGDLQRFSGSFQEAHECYARALSVGEENYDLARVLGSQAQAAFGAGRLDAARDLFGEALRLLGHDLPNKSWSKTLALARELLTLAGPQGSEKELSEADRLASKLLNLLAYVLAYSDGFGLIWANLRCLNLARKAKPGREMGVALITHAVALLYVPSLLKRSKRSAWRAVELMERYGTEHDLAGALARAGTVEMYLGDPAKALELYQKAVPVLQTSGDRYDAHLGAYGLGVALYSVGQLNEARSVLRDNLRECQAVGDSLGGGATLRALGLLETLTVEATKSVPDNPVFPSVGTLLAQVRGLHYLQRGELVAATAQFEEATMRARSGGDVLETLWSGSFLLHARRLRARREAGSHRSGLEAKAEKEARRLLAVARKGYHLFLPRLYRELALLKIQQGDFEQGESLLKQALEAARERGMIFEEAQSWWELAEIYRVTEKPHLQFRDTAHRLFGITGRSWEGSFRVAEHSSVSLSERFDQVIVWSQVIASKRTPGEVIEAARLASEALFRCPCLRLPGSGSPEKLYVVEEGQQDRFSTLVIPVGPTAELHCRGPEVEGFFGEEELRLAGLIKGQAAVALANSSLWTEIQDREAELEQLFSSVPAGVAVVDVAGIILKSNPRLTEMLGQCPLGRSLKSLLQVDDRPWFEQALRILLDESGPQQRELRLELQDGRMIWGELSLQSLPGSEGRAIVALADVSQRRLEQVAEFQERERKMLSSEVHDVLSQPLVGLHLQLEALSMRLPEASSTLREAAGAARDVLDQSRGLIARLRSPQLESEGLAQSIREAVQDLLAGCKTRTALEIDSAVDEVSPLAALFAYRITVEAITNCARHAGADRLIIRMRVVGGRLRGLIADDGAGFDRSVATAGHFGLRIMRGRAELLGGTARIRSAPGKGTAVFFQLPMEG